MGAVGGAVGASPWEKVPRHLRPEAGLLGLRSGMEVFANLRPAICHSALANASTLKREVIEGLDLMIVRELTGGVYFGKPRGVEVLPDGQKRAVDTQVYTTHEIERVTRVAFELARGRRNKVTSAEKANVMETGAFWREVVTALHAREYPDVTLEHMLADNAAMQLVKNPKQFDVLVTDNLFGDILSDEAAQLTGSLGMLPSAALGDPGKFGLRRADPGSAADIAGQGVANPLAAILSFEMALRWSLGRPDLADRLGGAVQSALERGARTRDDSSSRSLSTRQRCSQALDAVLAGEREAHQRLRRWGKPRLSQTSPIDDGRPCGTMRRFPPGKRSIQRPSPVWLASARPRRHCSTIWVCVTWASSLPSAPVILVVHTLERRPTCSGVASPVMVSPTKAEAMKLVLLSSVVVPSAGGRLRWPATAPSVSANAI